MGDGGGLTVAGSRQRNVVVRAVRAHGFRGHARPGRSRPAWSGGSRVGVTRRGWEVGQIRKLRGASRGCTRETVRVAAAEADPVVGAAAALAAAARRGNNKNRMEMTPPESLEQQNGQRSERACENQVGEGRESSERRKGEGEKHRQQRARRDSTRAKQRAQRASLKIGILGLHSGSDWGPCSPPSLSVLRGNWLTWPVLAPRRTVWGGLRGHALGQATCGGAAARTSTPYFSGLGGAGRRLQAQRQAQPGCDVPGKGAGGQQGDGTSHSLTQPRAASGPRRKGTRLRWWTNGGPMRDQWGGTCGPLAPGQSPAAGKTGGHEQEAEASGADLSKPLTPIADSALLAGN